MTFFHSVAKLLFYFGGAFYFFFEVYVLTRPGHIVFLSKEASRRREEEKALKAADPAYKAPERKWKDFSDDEKSGAFLGLVILTYWIWTILGFITGNWLVFVTIAVLGLLTAKLPKVITRNRPYVALDAIISLFLIGFAIINAYQLHLSWRDMLALLGF